MPTVIFKEAEFDTKVLGKTRIASAARRFRTHDGRDFGLIDLRKDNPGRFTTKGVCKEEIIRRLEKK